MLVFFASGPLYVFCWEDDLFFLYRLEFPELAQVDYITTTEPFTPELTKRISKEYAIPKQRMYMAAFSDKFPFTYTEMGGIRLIASQQSSKFQARPSLTQPQSSEQASVHVEVTSRDTDGQGVANGNTGASPGGSPVPLLEGEKKKTFNLDNV